MPSSRKNQLPAEIAKSCRHLHHVGTCTACQRARIAKRRQRLAEVQSGSRQT